MASFLDKFKINTAVDNYTKLDLGCDHISTANFMQYNVAYSKELVPGERININMETFTRLQPMPVPTFGRAMINNRAFFVPFRTIFPKWNDFITDAIHSNANGNAGLVNNVPTISGTTFWQLLTGKSSEFYGAYATQLDGTATAYDYIDATGTSWKLTALGRQTVKILNSLGYVINPSTSLTNTYSAMPLLALAKVYCDWYYPSQYVGLDAIYNSVNGMFGRDNATGVSSITVDELNNIFTLMRYVCYDSDYFVSAWDNPAAPAEGAYSPTTINDTTFSGNAVSMTATQPTPVLTGNSISQYAVTALRSLSDYMKRHQLAGSRALDRYLSRFGVTLSAEKLNRSIYIGKDSSNLQFGDIMSTASTDGANLGSYAGKGLGYGETSFDYSTDEYGMLIIVSTIIPKTGYYQGVDRNVLHKTRFDFWTPEFDNLGVQAIEKQELFVPTDLEDFTPGDLFTGGVFGFTPRYSEYKIGRDKLTGDFRYDSMNVGTEAWHTLREVDYSVGANIVHNRSFVVGSDADQYSRIFYNTDADAADKFNVIYHFEITSQSPMKPLYENYEFEDKGDKMILDVNGTKMN